MKLYSRKDDLFTVEARMLACHIILVNETEKAIKFNNVTLDNESKNKILNIVKNNYNLTSEAKIYCEVVADNIRFY